MKWNHPCTSAAIAIVAASAFVASGQISRGDWQSPIFTSANFVVHTSHGMSPSTCASIAWERARSDLQHKWLGIVGRDWSPRCDVYLHATREDYARAVGPGAANTNGSSLIQVQGTRIVTRRIDLCCQVVSRGLEAFPHELTHVVLADLFPTNPLPPWADEGMAILADTAEKRRLHRRDLAAAFASGRCFETCDLIEAACCPLDESRATFYGQSVALVKYLVEIGGEHRFVKFLKEAQQFGYERALVEQYEIGSMRELHSDWVGYCSTSREVGFVSGKPSVSLVSAGGRPPGRRSDDSSLGANR